MPTATRPTQSAHRSDVRSRPARRRRHEGAPPIPCSAPGPLPSDSRWLGRRCGSRRWRSWRASGRRGPGRRGSVAPVMQGMLVKLQENADSSMASIRGQLAVVVTDLTQTVGALSREMMSAAQGVTMPSQASALPVVEQTGSWSEATATRLECLFQSKASGDTRGSPSRIATRSPSEDRGLPRRGKRRVSLELCKRSPAEYGERYEENQGSETGR